MSIITPKRLETKNHMVNLNCDVDKAWVDNNVQYSRDVCLVNNAQDPKQVYLGLYNSKKFTSQIEFN